MKQLINTLAQDHLWDQWVSANSASSPTLDSGCISGVVEAAAKAGCISRKGGDPKAGCISRKGGSPKAGCISRAIRPPKAGCISRGVNAPKAGCIS